ncbi:hypothetical protein BDZ88DRAFT_276467 [Geranomyces variabilis]|nr:hypothetical protein BDZ88DRAFT_276467 [Geranomyces variabilis]KAJ3138579.1 hypothetical protein HDU90_001021 [Geranomyces variabilis]
MYLPLEVKYLVAKRKAFIWQLMPLPLPTSPWIQSTVNDRERFLPGVFELIPDIHNDFYNSEKHYGFHDQSVKPALPHDSFSRVLFDSVCHSTHTDNCQQIVQADGSAQFTGAAKRGYESSPKLRGLPVFWLSPVIKPDRKSELQHNLTERATE